jgi:nitroreductase
MIYERIINRRTIRKFKQQDVPREILRKCVDAARLSPSGSNAQPLKYVIVDEENLLPRVFSTLKWAASIPGYKHAPDEVPAAYIVMLLDTKIREQPGNDTGIAAMSISMVAYEEGVASCMLGSVDRLNLKQVLKIPDHLQILLVVALGYPAETSIAVELKGEDTKYWLDDKGVLNVPKRRLEDIAVWNVSEYYYP